MSGDQPPPPLPPAPAAPSHPQTWAWKSPEALHATRPDEIAGGEAVDNRDLRNTCLAVLLALEPSYTPRGSRNSGPPWSPGCRNQQCSRCPRVFVEREDRVFLSPTRPQASPSFLTLIPAIPGLRILPAQLLKASFLLSSLPAPPHTRVMPSPAPILLILPVRAPQMTARVSAVNLKELLTGCAQVACF